MGEPLVQPPSASCDKGKGETYPHLLPMPRRRHGAPCNPTAGIRAAESHCCAGGGTCHPVLHRITTPGEGPGAARKLTGSQDSCRCRPASSRTMPIKHITYTYCDIHHCVQAFTFAFGKQVPADMCALYFSYVFLLQKLFCHNPKPSKHILCAVFNGFEVEINTFQESHQHRFLPMQST